MSFLVNGLTDVEGGEGREDQSLNGTGKQAKQHDRQGHKQRHQRSQNGHCQFVGKDVAKQTERQGQRLGEFLDDLEREHDRSRLHVVLEELQTLVAQAGIEERQGHQQGHGHGGVDVSRGRTKFAARQMNDAPGDQSTAPVADKNEQEQGADEHLSHTSH